jgi:dienelactone hydrolase
VLACAIQQGLVDTRRIHVSGYSAGGLQCAAMAYLRSGYVASVLCMSGGFMSTSPSYSLQDPQHVPAAVAAHGAAGSDVFILDFATCSANFCASVTDNGGLAIDCNDGGDHIGSMSSRASTMGAVAWQFFAENRYGSPQTYSGGLPAYFPDYCAVAQ